MQRPQKMDEIIPFYALFILSNVWCLWKMMYTLVTSFESNHEYEFLVVFAHFTDLDKTYEEPN